MSLSPNLPTDHFRGRMYYTVVGPEDKLLQEAEGRGQQFIWGFAP